MINALISFGIIYLAFYPYPDWPRVNAPALVAASFFGASERLPLRRPVHPAARGRGPVHDAAVLDARRRGLGGVWYWVLVLGALGTGPPARAGL